MSSWYSQFEQELLSGLEQIKSRDLRFFRVEEFLRNARRVDEFSDSCRDCHTLQYDIEKQKNTVAGAIRVPGKERRAYDRLQSRLNSHMRNVHGFYPPFYFTYLHSFLWTLALGVISLLVSLLFPGADIFAFLAPAFAVGVVTGQLVGGKKDRKIRSTNKLL
ncbi:hypothetical protein [Gaoshiqia sp. Z1-71]|uniref:hypothetical protein n=1 Tax=Gaoshiqia hydrogeniformans TaxID=3290090 RepID=UPI003BF90B07